MPFFYKMKSPQSPVEQDKKIIESIQKRIQHYNQHFNGSLLQGLTLEAMACQFLESETDYFESESSQHLKPIFKPLKDIKKQEQVEHSDFSYFLWKDGRIKDHNFLISPIEKDIHQTLDVTKYQLYILMAIDINEDNSKDVFVLTVFKVETSNFNIKKKKEKLNEFLEYPKDFFNSPVVVRYFEDLKYKSEVRNFSHSVFNTYPGIISNLSDINKRLIRVKSTERKALSQELSDAIHSSELVLWSLRGISDKFDDCLAEMERLEIKTLKDLLEFIMKGLKTQDLEFRTKFTHVKDLRLCKQQKRVIISIFSIFINLLKNASRSRSYIYSISTEILYVTVKMWNVEGDLFISIKNPCDRIENVEEVKNVLTSRYVPSLRKGLPIIRQKMNELEESGWQLEEPEYLNNELEIKIKIKNSLKNEYIICG